MFVCQLLFKIQSSCEKLVKVTVRSSSFLSRTKSVGLIDFAHIIGNDDKTTAKAYCYSPLRWLHRSVGEGNKPNADPVTF